MILEKALNKQKRKTWGDGNKKVTPKKASACLKESTSSQAIT
jgi:hypothetical protein